MSMLGLIFVVLAAGFLIAVVVGVVVLFKVLGSRSSKVGPALAAQLAASGETVLRGPASASYRGGSAPGYSKVKGNCLLVLTDRRLVFAKLVGQMGEIPRERIVGVREDKVFLGSVVGGQTHLVVQLPDGEVGFFVDDHQGWMSSLRT